MLDSIFIYSRESDELFCGIHLEKQKFCLRINLLSVRVFTVLLLFINIFMVCAFGNSETHICIYIQNKHICTYIMYMHTYAHKTDIYTYTHTYICTYRHM